MKSFIRPIFILILGLALLGFTEASMATNNNKSGGNDGKNSNQKKCPQIWCPKVKFVCKPCKKGHRPPSSTCNPKDICCSFEIVGWYDCSPKNGKCSGPKDNYNFWEKDDGRDDNNNDKDRDEKNSPNDDKNRNDKP